MTISFKLKPEHWVYVMDQRVLQKKNFAVVFLCQRLLSVEISRPKKIEVFIPNDQQEQQGEAKLRTRISAFSKCCQDALKEPGGFWTLGDVSFSCSGIVPCFFNYFGPKICGRSACFEKDYFKRSKEQE